MGKVLHIKDAYFKIPDKCKDDFGCAITLLGIYLQMNNLTMDDMKKAYEDTDVSDFLNDDEQKCLLSCSIETDLIKKVGDTLHKGFEKRFNQGDIVYWCHCDGSGEYSVHYGMVDEQFSDAVCIDYLAPRERRRVDGVPIDEFQSEQRYRKLPKGWTYNTRLFEISYDPLTEEEIAFNIDIRESESIKTAYEKGFLVKDSTIYHGDIEAEITKDGFRIVKKYPMWKHHIDHTSIRPDKVYFTYEEAKKEVDENIAEFHRQANLSDYDWSVEQIDKTLKRYQIINDTTDEEVKQYRDWLLAMSNVEDVETRIFGGNIQWKYWKNKKWNNIEL